MNEPSLPTATPPGEVQRISISQIEPNPFQPRQVFNEVALQELAASIQMYGILQPLLVRRHAAGYQLVSGERRLQASKRLGASNVPAVIKDYTDRQMLEVALVENVQREDIGPLEAAEAYKRLIDEFAMTQEQVAVRVGKSRSAVANTLRLLRLPENIRKSIAMGELSEGHARSLLAISDPEWQQRVWRQITSDRLSVRDTERLAQRDTSPESPPSSVSRETDGGNPASPPASRDPNLSDFEHRLRLHLGTRVRLRGTDSLGTISIDYYSAEDLERVASLLGLSGQ